MGSGIHRILEAYPQSIYQFSPNFIRVVIPFSKGFIEPQEILKKATPEATPEATDKEQSVLEFCQTPKSRQEIQQYLGLSDNEYVRKSIVKPLIDSGKLALTIPDKPTSPKQKFITVQTGQ